MTPFPALLGEAVRLPVSLYGDVVAQGGSLGTWGGDGNAISILMSSVPSFVTVFNSSLVAVVAAVAVAGRTACKVAIAQAVATPVEAIHRAVVAKATRPST